MEIRSLKISHCAVVGIGLSVALSALDVSAVRAQNLVTFAQFTAFSPSNEFQFTNNGSTTTPGGTLSLIGDPTHGNATIVHFNFPTPNGYFTGSTTDPLVYGQDQNANFSLSASTSGLASVSSGTISQGLSNISMSFIARTPKSGFSNLLTVSFLSGVLSSATGAGNPTFTSSSPAMVSGNIAGYSSDFLDFVHNTFTSEQFSISMSGANNTSPVTGNALTIGTNGVVNSFTASGTGTFSSNPVPASFDPTPASPGELSLLTGVLIGAFQFGRAKIRSKAGKANVVAV